MKPELDGVEARDIPQPTSRNEAQAPAVAPGIADHADRRNVADTNFSLNQPNPEEAPNAIALNNRRQRGEQQQAQGQYRNHDYQDLWTTPERERRGQTENADTESTNYEIPDLRMPIGDGQLLPLVRNTSERSCRRKLVLGLPRRPDLAVVHAQTGENLGDALLDARGSSLRLLRAREVEDVAALPPRGQRVEGFGERAVLAQDLGQLVW